MKLLADNKIPHVTDFFGLIDEVVLLPADRITCDSLKNTDVLLVRTVTSINAELLENTTVRWVGTATTGIDHVDTQWLSKNNIGFADAAGANAAAVAEYIYCCIHALQSRHYLNQKNLTAGIIGYGRIGRLVANVLLRCGFRVLSYDPFCPHEENPYDTSFDALIQASDLITLHAPLTNTGPHPTFHMINQNVMRQMKKNVVLMNAARGGVIDQSALFNTSNILACLDVWENEPHIDLELLNKVVIGTPHIAGYSVSAKYRATQMLYEKAADFFNWEKKSYSFNTPINQNKFDNPLLHYNPLTHTAQFRAAFTDKKEVGDVFIKERANYPLR